MFILMALPWETTYQITIEKKSVDEVVLQAEIDKRLEKINQLMSTYIDDSELSLLTEIYQLIAKNYPQKPFMLFNML